MHGGRTTRRPLVSQAPGHGPEWRCGWLPASKRADMCPASTLSDACRRDGFRVFPNLIDPTEAAQFAAELCRISGLRTNDNSAVRGGQRSPFYRHGGVAANPSLWPLLMHRHIIAAVAEVLDAPPKCLPGIDTIGMHASETDPHRDASPGELPALAQAPFETEYPVVRVILYPNSPGERFGCLPGSHRQPGRPRDLAEAAPDAWRWLVLRSCDALVFDPRIVHAGAPITNPKPMMITTYGADGPCALQTYFHARIKTAQLGFTDAPNELLHRLASVGILLRGVTEQANWEYFSTVWAAPVCA